MSLESFRTPWRDFYASLLARVSDEYLPILDDSLCFFTERWELRIVVVTKGEIRSREFMGYTRMQWELYIIVYLHEIFRIMKITNCMKIGDISKKN